MLRIPFWYSLRHDEGTGRGIGGINEGYYKQRYEAEPSDANRAAMFGADFLGTPIDYESEKGKKSLRFRGQIAKLKKEYEKGNIR